MSYFQVTMKDVQSHAKDTGCEFFNRENVKMANTRTFSEAIYAKDCYWFITADRFGWEKTDRYTVRKLCLNGNVKTVGDIGKYPSYKAAYDKLIRYLSKED